MDGVTVASYADDATPYSTNKTKNKRNRAPSEFLFQWFELSNVKINSGKSRILFSEDDVVSVNIDNNAVTSENKNELLGIVLDSKIYFEDHK